MLAEFTQWLLTLIKEFLSSLWDFFTDAIINIVDLIGSAVVGLLSMIPVPSFLSGGLQQIYGMLDPGILYIASSTGLPQALAIIGTGYLFRLGRKVATLFQW